MITKERLQEIREMKTDIDTDPGNLRREVGDECGGNEPCPKFLDDGKGTEIFIDKYKVANEMTYSVFDNYVSGVKSGHLNLDRLRSSDASRINVTRGQLLLTLNKKTDRLSFVDWHGEKTNYAYYDGKLLQAAILSGVLREKMALVPLRK